MQCLFGGSETDSKEHVVPAWLQRKFKLQEQTINIPNGTTLKYKLLVVPADKTENSRFGEIEDRISNGQFNLDEVYLWALKIHIGMIFRDSSLHFDIRDPSSDFILDIGNFDSQIKLFRLLYGHWKRGGKTSPSPFGSVFILDSLLPHDEFDLFHCLVTGTIGIHIGGKFIVVFLWDQCDAMAANIGEQWTRRHLPTAALLLGHEDYQSHCYMAHHVWACESAYWLYRNRRPMNMLWSADQITLVPPILRPQARPPVEDEYRHVCASFGLELTSFNGEVANVYTQHVRIKA